MMRRRARRYWGGLLVVGLLIIPAYSSDTPVGPSAAPVRFLATAEVLSRAIQTLSSFVTESPILLPIMGDPKPTAPQTALRSDRKSTRLNSSHSQISYAVFCLKQKSDTRHRRHCPQHLTHL